MDSTTLITCSSLLDGLDSGIILLDKDECVVYVNKYLNNYLPFADTDLRGKTLNATLPSKSVKIRQAITDALEKNLPSFISNLLHPYALPLLDKTSNRRIEQKVTVKPIKFNNNKYCLITISDVSKEVMNIHHLEDEVTAREEKIGLVNDILSYTALEKGLDETVANTCRKICSYLGANIGHVYNFDATSEQLYSSSSWAISDKLKFKNFVEETSHEALSLSNELVAIALKNQGNAVPVQLDLLNDSKRIEEAIAQNLHSVMVFPIYDQSSLKYLFEFFFVREASALTESPNDVISFLQILFSLKLAANRHSLHIDNAEETKRPNVPLRALSSEHSAFEAMMQASADMIIIINSAGIMQSVNEAVSKMFGYSTRELVGNNVSMLMPKTLAVEHDSHIHRYLTTGISRIIGKGKKVVAKKRSGETFPVQLSVGKYQEANETCFIGILHDLTEVEEKESQLIDSNNAKVDFLSHMSHELRTPLNSIMGYAQLMLAQLKSAKEKTNFVDDANHIYTASKQLLQLIDQILNFARIDKGELNVNLMRIDLGLIINNALSVVQGSLFEQKQFHFEVENLAYNKIYVLADPDKLTQAIINLLSNAVKYSPDTNRVKISIAKLNELYSISITDYGIGIADQDLPLVFQEFARFGELKGKVQGTGIGLALSRKLVQAMHGDITVTSKLGKGSTFSLFLPVYQQQESHSEEISHQKEAKSEAKQSSQERPIVLYIEDNDENIDLLKRVVEYVDADLCAAKTLAKGIDLAVKSQPSLVVVDMNLPDGNAFDYIERAQADPRLQDIPAIVCSADAITDKQTKAIECGFKDYIVKPINIEHFITTAKKYLG